MIDYSFPAEQRGVWDSTDDLLARQEIERELFGDSSFDMNTNNLPDTITSNAGTQEFYSDGSR